MLQVNARLVSVSDPSRATGGRDDWDAPAAPGEPHPVPARWDAGADAYYREKVRRSFGAEQVVTVEHTLWIESTVAVTAAIATDDVLTIDYQGRTITGRAKHVAVSRLPGIPPELQTTRMELELG